MGFSASGFRVLGLGFIGGYRISSLLVGGGSGWPRAEVITLVVQVVLHHRGPVIS